MPHPRTAYRKCKVCISAGFYLLYFSFHIYSRLLNQAAISHFQKTQYNVSTEIEAKIKVFR